jgi:hypothetical protein
MQLLKIDDLIRVGRNYDGGYVISESLMKQSSVLLSFGINDDWSFEEDFYGKSGIGCYGFDFSIHKNLFLQRGLQNIKYFFGDIIKRKKFGWDRIEVAKGNFFLHKKFNSFFKKNKFFSLGIDDTTHDYFKSMSDILKQHFGGKTNIFLKVDIEGYEFKVINDILKNKDRFHSLAMEIHNVHDERNDFNSFIEKIQQHFYVYHIHANNYSSINKKDGFPNVIEISCIRKDLIDEPFFYNDLSHLPIKDIDFPNNVLSADFKW